MREGLARGKGRRIAGNFSLLLLLSLLAFPSCRPESFKEPPPACSDAPCRYKKAVEEGKSALDHFDPVRAEENFARALTAAQEGGAGAGLSLCTPHYGLLLAYTQLFFLHLNSFLGGLIGTLASGNPGSLLPQQTSFAADLFDYIENFYRGNFVRALSGISREAKAVEGIPDCEFQWEAGIPFRLLNNSPFSQIQNNRDALGVEVRIGKRWDLVEARLLLLFSEFLQGLFGYVLAHSFDFNNDQWTQIPILGQDLKFLGECLLRSSTFYGTSIDPTLELLMGSPKDNQNGVVDTVNECFIRQLGPYLFPLYWFRRLGFLVGDNPKTLADHPRRWQEFMPEVDNHFALAFSAASDLFPAFQARSLRYAANPARADLLREFALVFEDHTPVGAGENPDQPDGVVNKGDSFSFGVVDTLVKIPGPYNPDLSTLAKTVIGSFSLPIQDELALTTLKNLLATLRDQFFAVDDPGRPSNLLKFQDLSPLFFVFSVFANLPPPPNALAFSFTNFFRDPVPLRTLTPYWQAMTSLTITGHEVNEFIVEAEFYPTIPTNTSLGSSVTVPVYNLFLAPLFEAPFSFYTKPQDAPHFLNRYEYLDFTQGVQTPQPRISYSPSSLIPLPVTTDCFAPTNVTAALERVASQLSRVNPNTLLLAVYLLFSFSFDYYHYYFLFQDPSFHGLILVNTAGLPDPPCNLTLETTDFQRANLYTLHRVMIGYYHWFRPVVDNIFALLDQLTR